MVEAIEEFSDEKLVELAKSVHEAVNITDCYSPTDLIMLDRALRELERRGHNISKVLCAHNECVFHGKPEFSDKCRECLTGECYHGEFE
jgi:hypothetical protein